MLTYRQVWSGPKVDLQGTVSPDGRYLSYVDWDTGDLALHDFVGNSHRRLTNKGNWTQNSEFAEESAISRDGKQVAYSWFNTKNRYEIRIAGLPTSGILQPRLLLDRDDIAWIGPYDWSPDGKWLAVEWQEKKETQNHHVGLLSTQDGSLRKLKSSLGGATRMFFSPNGRFLAADFASGSNRARHVFLLSVDRTGEIEAVADPGQNVMMGWSPDGKRLLFASDRRGSMDLWAIPIAAGKPQGLAELIRPDVAPWSLGVTASGALYVGAEISDRDINVASLDLNTGKLLAPPSRPIRSSIGSQHAAGLVARQESIRAYVTLATGRAAIA